MVLPVYLTLIGISVAFSGAALFIRDARNIIVSLVAGVAWGVTAFNSSSVNEIVVYGTSDYLKEFNLPVLGLLFGLIGAGFILAAIYRAYTNARDTGLLEELEHQ